MQTQCNLYNALSRVIGFHSPRLSAVEANRMLVGQVLQTSCCSRLSRLQRLPFLAASCHSTNGRHRISQSIRLLTAVCRTSGWCLLTAGGHSLALRWPPSYDALSLVRRIQTSIPPRCPNPHSILLTVRPGRNDQRGLEKVEIRSFYTVKRPPHDKKTGGPEARPSGSTRS